MRLCFRFALLVFLVLGTAVVGSAFEKTSDVSISAIVAPVGPTEAPKLVADTTGFEAGEGFSVGYLDGQVGWSVMAASLVEPQVSTANPNSGTQHLRISLDPAVVSGTTVGGFSPEVTDSVVDACSVDIYVAIGAAGGSDYDVVPQAPSQSFLTARVNFSYLGDINVLDDTGSGLTFIDTGADWTAGSYQLLRIVVDPIGNTIDYYYGGALIYSSVAGVFAGTVIEQVVLLSDNYSVGEAGDFDDLVIDYGDVPVELQSLSIE